MCILYWNVSLRFLDQKLIGVSNRSLLGGNWNDTILRNVKRSNFIDVKFYFTNQNYHKTLFKNEDRRGQMAKAHFTNIEVLVKNDFINEW